MTTLIGAANVMPRWRHSSTSYFGFSRLYETNSSELVSVKSLIGKTLLKTPCRPMSSRFVERDVDLQELVVATLLDVDQVRDLDDLLELREALAGPEVLLDQ